MKKQSKITVCVVDDEDIVRMAIVAMLESVFHFKVIGDAGSCDEAVKMVLDKKPQVILMDITMPDKNGIEATRLILKKNPDARIIMLSGYCQPALIRDALNAGAKGFISKGCDPSELTEAITSVTNGGGDCFSQCIRHIVFDSFAEALPQVDEGVVDLLTSLEIKVLTRLANGQSSKEIADALSISTQAVSVHRRSVATKLQIEGQAQLVKYAIRVGLTTV